MNKETGLSFPDVSLYKKLCQELDISIEELINSEKSTSQEDKDKAIITTIKKENKTKKKLIYLSSISIIVILTLIIGSIFLYKKEEDKLSDYYERNLEKSTMSRDIDALIKYRHNGNYPDELGDEPFKNKNMLISIEISTPEYIPVLLALYDDETYELFTTYESCKPGKICNYMLKRTKSVKGTYHYDIIKIIEASTNADKIQITDKNRPEYIINLGESLIEKYDTLDFIVEKGKKNKYLDELLNSINVDLTKCSKPEYIE